jgi:hypothetical protein
MKERTPNEGHPVDLLLPFLEKTLDPKEMSTIRNHVEKCDQCREELKSLEKITTALKTNASLFCPEPWEIYEFIETGKDPGQKIANHLNECSLCRHEAESFKTAPVNQKIPGQMWNELSKELPQSAPKRAPLKAKTTFWKLPSWSLSFLRIPVLATASAVAILCVVLLYPGSQPKFIVALSSEDWNHSSTSLKLMAPRSQNLKSLVKPEESSKPIVVVIVLLDDSSSDFNAQRIDSLYRALQPSKVLTEKFEFVSPLKMKNFIDSGAVKSTSKKELIDGIRDQLNVSEVIIINILPKKHEFEIRGELISTGTGKILREKVETRMSENQLNSGLQNILEFLN